MNDAGPSRASSGSHASIDSAGGDPRDSLWVKAPEFQGWLLKKGFRFRRKWVRRWVVISNREVTYYEKETPTDGSQLQGNEPRGSVTLQRDLQVLTQGLPTSSSKGPMDLVLYPGGGEAPWELRAETMADKEAWVAVLQRCVLIASWLVQFQMGGLLGVGAAAVVREVRVKATGEKFALKIVTIHDPRMRSIAVQEVEVLERVTEIIKHRNLVKIKKVYQSADKLLIAMPLCSGGELYERIASLKRFTELDAAAAVYRTLDALRALHTATPPILHLDVKPENLLYESASPDAELIVTDFGLARVYENAAATTTTITTATASNNNTTGAAHQGGGAGEAAGAAAGGGADKQQQKRRKQRMVGTVGYMAPEVIRDRLYSPAADVFSTGVVLYTLLVGYPPFPGREDQEVLQNTVRGNYRMDPRRGWGEVSDEAQALVKRLLDPNPATRITTTEALASPWLSRGRPWSEAELQQYQEEQEEKEGAMRMGAGCAGSSSAAASSAAAARVGASLSSSPTMSPLLSPLSSSSSPSSPLSLSPRQQQQQQHGVAPVARHLSGVSAALAAQLPMLRRSQDSLREYNDQRITVRISRAADFVFNLDAAALDGSDETVGGSNNGGESSPGGGGGGADGGAGHAAGAGAGGGGAGSSSKPSGPGSLVGGMSLTGESGSGGGGGGGGSGAGGDDSGSSVVVNLQAPQIRKRVERAFRLLSPFNGGRLSPMRFQLLARVVNAGHWPPAPLFAFFDRDRDGCVSTEDFTAAQALIRTRSPDFIYLLFQAYLAALPTSKAAVNAANNNAAEHAGGMAEGEEGEEEEEEEDGGGGSGEEDEGPGGDGAGGGDGGGCGNGDDIFGGGGSTQGVSPGMLRGMRQQQQQNNSGGGGRRQRQRGGTVDMTSSVTREHVRAMFRARLPFVGSGSEGEATRQQHEKMADKAFDAAVKAVFGDDAPSRSPRQQPSQLGSLVTALDTPSPSLAPSGGPPAPPPLALDAPSPPATPDSKQRRGLGAGVSSVEVPSSPSQDVWENRMGDLLPSKLNSSFAALGVDDASPAFEGGQQEIEPAVGFRFPQFRKASLAVPILCEVMLMETRKHAMRAVGNSDRDATPLVDSVIKEEETD